MPRGKRSAFSPPRSYGLVIKIPKPTGYHTETSENDHALANDRSIADALRRRNGASCDGC